MNWFTSNLLPIAFLALLLFLGSFVRPKVRLVRPNTPALMGGVFLLTLMCLVVLKTLKDPPSPDEIVDDEQLLVPPELPSKVLDRLRLEWDANAVANWPAAETLATISNTSYAPPYLAEREFRSLGFTEVISVVQGSMIGYVISGEDVTVIVFRGTDFNELSDWLSNLTTAGEETANGLVHKGFYLAYQSMKSQVDAILNDRQAKHLWVTGHSLGGALALMCAYDLEQVEQRYVKGLITFGQPKVAGRQFANYIEMQFLGRYARFVNRTDSVPKVPPSYGACGSLVWFTDEGVKRSVRRLSVYGSTADKRAMKSVEELPLSVEKEGDEIESLTAAEFEALKVRLKAEQMPVERLPDGTPIAMYGATAPSFIEDHAMLLYLEETRKLLGLGPIPAEESR